MTLEQAIKIFLNRGFDDNGVYQPEDWRTAIWVISNALKSGTLIIKEDSWESVSK